MEAPAGEFLAWYEWEVGPDYFDLDSHWTLRDLERQAHREQAVAWQGRTLSNRLRVRRGAGEEPS